MLQKCRDTERKVKKVGANRRKGSGRLNMVTVKREMLSFCFTPDFTYIQLSSSIIMKLLTYKFPLHIWTASTSGEKTDFTQKKTSCTIWRKPQLTSPANSAKKTKATLKTLYIKYKMGYLPHLLKEEHRHRRALYTLCAPESAHQQRNIVSPNAVS